MKEVKKRKKEKRKHENKKYMERRRKSWKGHSKAFLATWSEEVIITPTSVSTEHLYRHTLCKFIVRSFLSIFGGIWTRPLEQYLPLTPLDKVNYCFLRFFYKISQLLDAFKAFFSFSFIYCATIFHCMLRLPQLHWCLMGLLTNGFEHLRHVTVSDIHTKTITAKGGHFSPQPSSTDAE